MIKLQDLFPEGAIKAMRSTSPMAYSDTGPGLVARRVPQEIQR